MREMKLEYTEEITAIENSPETKKYWRERVATANFFKVGMRAALKELLREFKAQNVPEMNIEIAAANVLYTLDIDYDGIDDTDAADGFIMFLAELFPDDIRIDRDRYKVAMVNPPPELGRKQPHKPFVIDFPCNRTLTPEVKEMTENTITTEQINAVYDRICELMTAEQDNEIDLHFVAYDILDGLGKGHTAAEIRAVFDLIDATISAHAQELYLDRGQCVIVWKRETK